MTDPVDDIIAALNRFEAARDETDNIGRLWDIFGDFGSVPERGRAMPAMFSLLERFPDAEFGSPGPLVHELEAIPGYLPLLRESLRRRPTPHSVDMINRLLNSDLPAGQRASWLSELRAAFAHPLASEQTRMAAKLYLEHQEG